MVYFSVHIPTYLTGLMASLSGKQNLRTSSSLTMLELSLSRWPAGGNLCHIFRQQYLHKKRSINDKSGREQQTRAGYVQLTKAAMHNNNCD